MAKSKDCILTVSKWLVDPYHMKKEDIRVEDIAHSLCMQTRANGHFSRFYSVGQHCVNCALEARNRGYGRRMELLCLLHDASEAYIADIPRPVKHRLVGYAELEEEISRLIYDTFDLTGITEEEYRKVGEIDDAILYAEFVALMDIRIFDAEPPLSMKHNFETFEITTMYERFLRIFYQDKQTALREVVGVDGCKGGWAAFALRGEEFEFKVYATIEALCVAHADAEYIFIDMPVGLPESSLDKRPDDAVRKMLKGKASSIFNCPCRQAVYAADYETASALNKEILGVGLAKQSHAIAPKIREVDAFLYSRADLAGVLLESHPELCFARLAGGPVMEKKRESEGLAKRLHILSKYFEGTDRAFALALVSAKGAAPDDIADAMCLAVTAALAQRYGLKTVPEVPRRDARGLPMQMVVSAEI